MIGLKNERAEQLSWRAFIAQAVEAVARILAEQKSWTRKFPRSGLEDQCLTLEPSERPGRRRHIVRSELVNNAALIESLPKG